MSEKNYVRAVELYNKLRDTYPFSPYTVDAELSLADAYYLDEDYEQAAETYKDFESLHPRHEAIQYVLYQTGMRAPFASRVELFFRFLPRRLFPVWQFQ